MILDDILNFFRIYGSSALKNTVDGLRGFSNSNSINLMTEYSDAMQRGASPNTFLMRISQMEISSLAGGKIAELVHALKWTRLSWLITPFMFFLPIIINGWPRKGVKNAYYEGVILGLEELVYHLRTETDKWKLMYLASYLPAGLRWLLINLPPISNPYILKGLAFVDKYMFQLSLTLAAVAYFGLFLVGQSVMAVAAAITLSFGILDRNNYIPLPVRNFVKRWGWPVSIFVGILAGTPMEIFIFSLALPFYVSNYINLTSFISKALAKFSKTKPLSQEIDRRHRKIQKFDFQCQAADFDEAFLHIFHRETKIDPAHIKNSELLLRPPKVDGNLDDYLHLFDNIDWTENHSKVIEDNIAKDWRLKLQEESGLKTDYEKLRAEHKEFCDRYKDLEPAYLNQLVYMRQNLKTYIQRLRNNDIHSVVVGGEELTQRYAYANLAKLLNIAKAANSSLVDPQESEQKKLALVDNIVRLGFETGEYCGIALLRSGQATYRSLFIEGSDLTLKEHLYFIHQLEREQLFQEYYLKVFHILGGKVDDTHNYARAVAVYGPNLGLPADIAQYEELLETSQLTKDILGMISEIETAYWQTIRGIDLETEIMEAFGTPLLPIKVVDQWYNSFIDAHVTGSEEEKKELKERKAYLRHEDGKVALRAGMALLMALDNGVLALKKTDEHAENTYHHPASKSLPADPQPLDLINSEQSRRDAALNVGAAPLLPSVPAKSAASGQSPSASAAAEAEANRLSKKAASPT